MTIELYPRMLYRASKLQGPEATQRPLRINIGHHRHRGVDMDTLIVDSGAKCIDALKRGWHMRPDEAADQWDASKRRDAITKFVATEWKYLITTTIAIAAIVVTYIVASKP